MFVALLSSRGADARPAPRPSYAVAPSVISEATTAREGAGRTPESQGHDDGSAPGGRLQKQITRCSSRSGART